MGINPCNFSYDTLHDFAWTHGARSWLFASRIIATNRALEFLPRRPLPSYLLCSTSLISCFSHWTAWQQKPSPDPLSIRDPDLLLSSFSLLLSAFSLRLSAFSLRPLCDALGCSSTACALLLLLLSLSLSFIIKVATICYSLLRRSFSVVFSFSFLRGRLLSVIFLQFPLMKIYLFNEIPSSHLAV